MKERARIALLADSGKCPLCDLAVERELGTHIKNSHGTKQWEDAITSAKDEGMSDVDIGRLFNVSFSRLSKLLVEKRGHVSFGSVRPPQIRTLDPPVFNMEGTTVWAFRDRGRWATHSGHYRGNWSPYIPRNMILRHSGANDVVLDCFVGGGTTAVESLLLGRNFVGVDINKASIELTGTAIDAVRHYAERKGVELGAWTRLAVGDARRLSGVEDGSIDLICTHPPYAGIIRYSSGLEGDLSSLEPDEYVVEMQKAIGEQRRVLREQGSCVLLVGDKRKEKRVVPLGFMLIEAYLRGGFELDELVIKRQFNTRTTGLWYNRAMKGRFLLLAHEYLPSFSIGESQTGMLDAPIEPSAFKFGLRKMKKAVRRAETTSVWTDGSDANIVYNMQRLSGYDATYRLTGDRPLPGKIEGSVYISDSGNTGEGASSLLRRRRMKYAVNQLAERMHSGSMLGLRVRDRIAGGKLQPEGMLAWLDMKRNEDFRLREIVVVAEKWGGSSQRKKGHLEISHSYLLLYDRK